MRVLRETGKPCPLGWLIAGIRYWRRARTFVRGHARVCGDTGPAPRPEARCLAAASSYAHRQAGA